VPKKIITPMIIGFLLICSCSIGPAKVSPTRQMTVIDVDPNERVVQEMPAVLVQMPAAPGGRKIGERFFSGLLEVMRHENRRLRLITASDGVSLDFLQPFKSPERHLDVDAVADVARRKGYQGFMIVRIMDVDDKVEEAGLLWWRKPRHLLTVAVAVDVYDPFTNAKMFSRIEEKTVKTSALEYDMFIREEGPGIKNLNKMLANLAEDMGESAAGVIAGQPWKTTVLAAKAGEALLAAGGRSGLDVGDRLDVFEIRSTMQNLWGRHFRVPGTKTGQLRIVAVEGRFMRAAIEEGQADIQVGDMAVFAN
jgi:hypothetical protein